LTIVVPDAAQYENIARLSRDRSQLNTIPDRAVARPG
jgi:hypothetical protein